MAFRKKSTKLDFLHTQKIAVFLEFGCWVNYFVYFEVVSQRQRQYPESLFRRCISMSLPCHLMYIHTIGIDCWDIRKDKRRHLTR